MQAAGDYVVYKPIESVITGGHLRDQTIAGNIVIKVQALHKTTVNAFEGLSSVYYDIALL